MHLVPLELEMAYLLAVELDRSARFMIAHANCFIQSGGAQVIHAMACG